MDDRVVRVASAAELARALDVGVRRIEVVGTISGSPMITLPPGASLRGSTLIFGAKGVQLTTDNTLEDVTIETADTEIAVLNDTTCSTLGTLTLRNVATRGQVLLLAEDAVRDGHVKVETLRVEAADLRGRALRPHGFNVDALQGGFTMWNLQPDPAVVLTAELLDLSVGSAAEPVRGSGVFVSGHGNRQGIGDGGRVVVSELRIGEVHTDGGIPEGTPDLISAAVFVVHGVDADRVLSTGPVTTYGQNDMVLDSWGTVTTWIASAPVTSHRPSGIGFVNFGDTGLVDIQAPILTTGKGARGFNLYDGTLREGRFASITTTGDGSIGMQVSKPMGSLTVTGDVTTSGSQGRSLVRGVQSTFQRSRSASKTAASSTASTSGVGCRPAVTT